MLTSEAMLAHKKHKESKNLNTQHRSHRLNYKINKNCQRVLHDSYRKNKKL